MQWMVLETQFRVVPGRNYQEGRATIRHYSSQPGGAFSVIVQCRRLIVYSTSLECVTPGHCFKEEPLPAH